MSSDKTQDTKPIPRLSPSEPLAHYKHALIAAEATQRALVALHKSLETEGMTEQSMPVFRAWEQAKATAETLRSMVPPPNISDPL